MRNLHQNAYAVACFAVGVLAGTVLKCFNNGERVRYSRVRLDAVDVYHRADTAVVVLKTRGIEGVFQWSVYFLTHLPSSFRRNLYVHYYITVILELSIENCKKNNCLCKINGDNREKTRSF